MEIKDYIHYYLGCEVEYEGIINGKELKAEQQANEHDIFYIPQIKEVKGIKRGFLKRIDQLVDGTRRYRIGRRGLQTHYNTSRFRLVLRRLSSITDQEAIELATIYSGADIVTRASGVVSNFMYFICSFKTGERGNDEHLIIDHHGEAWYDHYFDKTRPGYRNIVNPHQATHYLISRSFWLFGEEAFETGLIIEKK